MFLLSKSHQDFFTPKVLQQTVYRLSVILAKNILLHFVIFSFFFNQIFFSFYSCSALADELPITADGTTNTQVTKTASGIDQINIAAPNSNGLSHNKFTDYNVNNSGQVINNFSGKVASEVASGSGNSAVTSTQIWWTCGG